MIVATRTWHIHRSKAHRVSVYLRGLTQNEIYLTRNLRVWAPTCSCASETHGREAQNTYGFRDSVPWSAMREKQWNMNKCISHVPPCYGGEKKRASREMTFPWACVHQLGDDKIKLCFPGRVHTRNGREEVTRSIRYRGIPSAAIHAAELAEKYSWKKRCAYTRKLRYPLSAAMNFDGSFSPRGAFGRNDADLHYAIYTRA